MLEVVESFFSSGSFIPHGHCYLWQSQLVWLHVLSDSIIAIAYYSIPITLIYFVRKRKDLPFDWIFLLFSAFIISCGTTHLMEVWTLWHPTYWLSGALKALTALVSLYTAIALVQLLPQALAIPSPAQLAIINNQLTQEIADRQQAEDQVRQLNQALEAKVNQRTAELERSILQVQDYADQVTLAMDAANMGAWDWDLTTQKITWSVHQEELLGYQPGTPERCYEDWARRVHPDDLAKTEVAVQQALETASDFAAEYRVVWDDKTEHWMATFGRCYFDDDGKPWRMLGVQQDITDRKQTETALLLSEERLRLATEAADIGMWFWELVDNRLIWTDVCKQLFGIDPTLEMTYERFINALHPDDRARTNAAVQRALTENQDYKIEYRTVWSDQSTHWILSQGRVFCDQQGQPIRMMGTAQDTTARKQAEIALQESEARFRTLADNISQLAWMADATGSIFWYNRRWFDYTGTTLEQMQGWGWQQLHHPDYVERVVNQFRSCIEAGEVWEDTFPIRGQDGKYRWFLSRAIPIVDPEGQILRWFGTNTDVTEIKHFQAVLEQQNYELDSFVHIVSHDLKAPLRAIANLSTWIEEDLEGRLSEDTQEQMALLRSRVYRMQAMIDGLLNYARVNQTELTTEPVETKKLILEVIDSIAPPSTFRIDIPSDLPVLYTNRLLLSQVLANLIGNGIKYNDRLDGWLRISAVDKGDFYEFAVVDNGPGIAQEYQKNIFMIFQTGNVQNRQDSTGVGLAIVKKIVENMTGTVWLESQVGEGTTFYFTWPKQLTTDTSDFS